MTNTLRSNLPEWKDLDDHAIMMKGQHMRDLFEDDPSRFDRFHIRIDDLLLDFSKQLIDQYTIEKLCDYAKACDLEGWRSKMFAGKRINNTEDRSVLHTALRANTDDEIFIDGNNIRHLIKDALDKMKDFSDNIRKEKRFTNIVNIGVGGSDLGSVMAYEALKSFADPELKLHFVSNIDATHLSETLRVIEPKKTLFIVTSKTFTTQETINNATSAMVWLQDKLGIDNVADHFVAISQNIAAAKNFGIKTNNIFPIWDWVGGRFSIWSAVGLPLCIAIGYDKFKDMLDGARAMDDHFKNARMHENIPIMLGLIGMWNRNFMGCESLAVIPYDQYLHRFPAYLQQLDMESNGKSIDREGNKVPYQTGPIVFGEPGTNAQHAFFQLIHQGTNIVPCEFISVIKSQNPIGDHQQSLLANAIAQTKALMDGRDSDNPHKSFEGNRPSCTLMFNEISPRTFGMLIALYEHKIFVQGVLWNVNSFDQCGVELGKIMAGQIIGSLEENSENITPDSSTQNLINMIKQIS